MGVGLQAEGPGTGGERQQGPASAARETDASLPCRRGPGEYRGARLWREAWSRVLLPLPLQMPLSQGFWINGLK